MRRKEKHDDGAYIVSSNSNSGLLERTGKGNSNPKPQRVICSLLTF